MSTLAGEYPVVLQVQQSSMPTSKMLHTIPYHRSQSVSTHGVLSEAFLYAPGFGTDIYSFGSQLYNGGRAFLNSLGAYLSSCTSTPATVSEGSGAYSINFTESGLGCGTSWSVTLTNSSYGYCVGYCFTTLLTSSAKSMVFTGLPSGSYNFNSSLGGYTVSPSSGSIFISSSNQTQDISFTLIPTYNVNFVESGLPAGANWSVTLTPQSYPYGPNIARSSTSSTIAFPSLDNQTYYSFFINNENGTNPNDYSPNPEIGTISIEGSNLNVPANFTNSECSSNPAGCVDSTLMLNTDKTYPGNRINENGTLGTSSSVYDPINGYLYVANEKYGSSNYDNGTIVVLNVGSRNGGQTPTLVTTINTENIGNATVIGNKILGGWGDPVALGISPDDQSIYASLSSGGFLEINATNNNVTKGIDFASSSFDPWWVSSSGSCPGSMRYDPTNYYLYITDYCAQLVWKIYDPAPSISENNIGYDGLGYYGGSGSFCTNSCNFEPEGIAYRSGNLYVSGLTELDGGAIYAGALDVFHSDGSFWEFYNYQSELSQIVSGQNGLYAISQQGTNSSRYPYTHPGTNGIAVINTTGGIIANLTSVGTPSSIAYDSTNGFLYASAEVDSQSCVTVCLGNYSVTLFNTATNLQLGSINVGGTGQLWYSSTTDEIYLGTYSQIQTLQTDFQYLTLGAGLVVVNGQHRFTALTSLVYETDGIGSVFAIDPSTGNVVDTVTVGNAPLSLATLAYGSDTLIFVANELSNSISVINATTDNVILTIPVMNYPLGISVNPGTNQVFVSNHGSNDLSTINIYACNTVLSCIKSPISYSESLIPLDGPPTGIAIDTLQSPYVHVYVALSEVPYSDLTSDVEAFNVTSDGSLYAHDGNIPVGQDPMGIAIDNSPQTGHGELYVTNYGPFDSGVTTIYPTGGALVNSQNYTDMRTSFSPFGVMLTYTGAQNSNGELEVLAFVIFNACYSASTYTFPAPEFTPSCGEVGLTSNMMAKEGAALDLGNVYSPNVGSLNETSAVAAQQISNSAYQVRAVVTVPVQFLTNTTSPAEYDIGPSVSSNDVVISASVNSAIPSNSTIFLPSLYKGLYQRGYYVRLTTLPGYAFSSVATSGGVKVGQFCRSCFDGAFPTSKPFTYSLSISSAGSVFTSTFVLNAGSWSSSKALDIGLSSLPTLPFVSATAALVATPVGAAACTVSILANGGLPSVDVYAIGPSRINSAFNVSLADYFGKNVLPNQTNVYGYKPVSLVIFHIPVIQIINKILGSCLLLPPLPENNTGTGTPYVLLAPPQTCTSVRNGCVGTQLGVFSDKPTYINFTMGGSVNLAITTSEATGAYAQSAACSGQAVYQYACSSVSGAIISAIISIVFSAIKGGQVSGDVLKALSTAQDFGDILFTTIPTSLSNATLTSAKSFFDLTKFISYVGKVGGDILKVVCMTTQALEGSGDFAAALGSSFTDVQADAGSVLAVLNIFTTAACIMWMSPVGTRIVSTHPGMLKAHAFGATASLGGLRPMACSKMALFLTSRRGLCMAIWPR